MKSTLSPQEIRSILQQQSDIADKLLGILTREFTALGGKDLQGFETILAAKQQSMEQLEELSRDILAMTRQHTTGKKDDIAKFLRHVDPQGTWGLEALWEQVDTLLHQCRQKNSTNGKIISLNHRHIQQALEILRHGGQASQACYGPTGAGQSAVSSRILGRV